MPDDTRHPTFEVSALDTLVTSLRNAHALEKQTTAVLEGQLSQITDYPELHARVKEHITETREQARRLEGALEACDSSASMVKDALLSMMGLGQSSVQSFADDAVLRLVVADMMTEHLEIASYRTLIALADMAGKPELRPRLEETLREEEAMAKWFDDNLESIVRRFVELKTKNLQRGSSSSSSSSTSSSEAKTASRTEEGAETSTLPGAGEGPEPNTSPKGEGEGAKTPGAGGDPGRTKG